MKKLSFVLLPFILLGFMPGCSCSRKDYNNNDNNDKHEYPNMNEEVFEVDIPTKDVAIKEIKLLNVPTQDVEIGYLSYMGIKMSIDYVDDTKATIPFTEKLLNEDHYKLLKTPGKKSIDFIFQGNHISFDVNLIEAKNPIYHKVSYLDHSGNVLKESHHAYLSNAVYNGPRVESFYEGDHYYSFSGKWDHQLDYVFCDFKTKAIYNKLDVRNHGFKYMNQYDVYTESGTQTVNSVAFVDEYNPDGYNVNNYALFYLGELENVEVLSGETFYHQQGHFDKILGAVDADDIVLDNITDTIVNKGYRVGEKEKSLACGFYNYLAWIEDPLWLKINPARSHYDMPNGIASSIRSDFLINSYQRKDGRYVSFSSIIKDDVLTEIKNDLEATDIQLYTSESYPTGYYRVSYVIDVDLSLQTLLYGMANESNHTMLLNPQSSQLIPGYIGGSLRPVLSYSPTGTFKEQKMNPIRYDVNDLLSFFGTEA